MSKTPLLFLASQFITGFSISIFIGMVFGLWASLSVLFGTFVSFFPNLFFCFFLFFTRNRTINPKLFFLFLLLRPFLLAFFLYVIVLRFVQNQEILILPFFLFGFLCSLKGYLLIPIFQKLLKFSF